MKYPFPVPSPNPNPNYNTKSKPLHHEQLQKTMHTTPAICFLDFPKTSLTIKGNTAKTSLTIEGNTGHCYVERKVNKKTMLQSYSMSLF